MRGNVTVFNRKEDAFASALANHCQVQYAEEAFSADGCIGALIYPSEIAMALIHTVRAVRQPACLVVPSDADMAPLVAGAADCVIVFSWGVARAIAPFGAFPLVVLDQETPDLQARQFLAALSRFRISPFQSYLVPEGS